MAFGRFKKNQVFAVSVIFFAEVAATVMKLGIQIYYKNN